MNISQIKELVREVMDFPKEGINFMDITTVLQHKDAYKTVIDMLANEYKNDNIDVVVGPEARGFIVGAPLAYALGAGFVPVRKPGKLPAKTTTINYDLEYGSNSLQMHIDAIKPGQKVLIVDDLLATGGTAAASVKLVEELGGDIVGVGFIIELEFLNGRNLLAPYTIKSLIKY
ncbi:adenine phosphoribosyltransferase [Clostridium sp. 'deep sea']|uniref:adenine phosphoribosyltransferase n=1 Tax=Clostridium sp. 'deep sea' TaxID=2779445 RepID=UPI0018969153|nr:adenine phosphoribosyltransferase [Clostridium sp. 'deep sea']QOR35686.1 adenine phosphoribosyltransferase [Clostridium sp. 'deep sea']